MSSAVRQMFDAYLPEDSLLGNLEYFRLYGYYDGPYLFSVRNKAGSYFLVLALAALEYDQRYLYLPISALRLAQVEQTSVSLHRAFREPEDGALFVVAISNDMVDFKRVIAADVASTDLPTESAKFPRPYKNIVEEERATALDFDALRYVATQTKQLVARIALAFPSSGFSGPASAIAKIVNNTQEAVNALTQWASGEPTDRGRIPGRILAQSELYLSAAFVSSVGLEFLVPERVSTVSPSRAPEALAELATLLDPKLSTSEVSARLRQLNKRSISKYRALLESIVDNHVTYSIASSGVLEETYHRAQITSRAAAFRLRLAEHAEIEQSERLDLDPVELVGLHARTKTYEILELTGARRRFSGKVADTAPSHVYESRIRQVYRASIAIVAEESTFTGEEAIRYRLLDLEERSLN